MSQQQQQSEAIKILHHTFDSEIDLALEENLAQQLNISTPINESLMLMNNEQNRLENEFATAPSPTLGTEVHCEFANNSVTSSALIEHSFASRIKVSTGQKMSFLLAVFDNIVGPKCLHFWSTHLSDFDNHMLKYIAVHTLNGELYNQEKLINNYKLRFYSIKEINYSILTIFFDANTIFTQNHHIQQQQQQQTLAQHDQSQRKDSLRSSNSSLNQQLQLTVLNCFSIIIPIENQQFLLDKADLIINAFENYVLEFKVFAEIWEKVNNVTSAISHLSKCIDELCTNLSTIENRGIKSINLRDTYFNDKEAKIDKEFLLCALTSHLLTNMNSIVIGTSSPSINKMIATLGYLMPKEKLTRSCYSLPDQTYISPYFCIQGFVNETTENNFNSLITADHLFNKNSPTSIIDLTTNKVYRTALLSEFVYFKEHFIERKVKLYYNSFKKQDLLDEWLVDTLLQSCDQSKSFLLADLLKQLECLDTQYGLREAHVDLFLKTLNLSALTLIEFVNNEISKHYQNAANNKKSICAITTKKLLKELNFRNEEDLFITISFADNLKSDFSMSFQLKS